MRTTALQTVATNDLITELHQRVKRCDQVSNRLLDFFKLNGARNGFPRKRRRMSAEAKQRISAAQRRRWAAKKTTKTNGKEHNNVLSIGNARKLHWTKRPENKKRAEAWRKKTAAAGAKAARQRTKHKVA